MDMSSLFPAEGGMGNVLNTRPTPHIEFKAGVLTHDPTSNMVTADPRKGIFQIITSTEDGLLHLQWRARNSSTVDHDLILFNAETEMKQVTSCPASARVYVLKWREADTRMFFWMQGKDPSSDARIISDVNSILENGPDSQQTSTTPETPRSVQPTSTNHPTQMDTDVNMQNQSILPDTPTAQPAPPASSAGRGQITVEQMSQALQSRGAFASSSSIAEAQRELILTTPTVGDLLNVDTLHPFLADSRVQEALTDLFQHLPEQDRSLNTVAQVLRSPPLRSQAAALSQALEQSEQTAELLRSFELPTSSSQGVHGLRAFLDALLILEQQTKESRD